MREGAEVRPVTYEQDGFATVVKMRDLALLSLRLFRKPSAEASLEGPNAFLGEVNGLRCGGVNAQLRRSRVE